MNNFFKRALELQPITIKNRHYLHENAEAGLNLPLTTKYICSKLTEIGLEPQILGDSNIVATIYGKKKGKTILLRCDTDALPMEEHTSLSFRTKTKAAHTCGHDIHTAMLISAAQILKENEDELEGNVKLMFEGGEEVFKAAQIMIDEGALENPKVDAAIGIHTALDFGPSFVAYSAGNMTSSCDGFKITLSGKGCHGALPHTGIDPINAGCHLYLAFQELIARECPSTESVSLTFGQFSSGNTHNIIPDTAVLQGTMRTYNQELRSKLLNRIHEICKATELMFNVNIDYEVLCALPSTYTDPALLDELVNYIKDIDTDINLVDNYKVIPSDDFAFISQIVPTVYFMLGFKVDGCEYPQHNPNVEFDEDAMTYGVALHAQCAFNWLKNNK